MRIPSPTLPATWRSQRARFACVINPSKSEVAGLDVSTEVSFLPMELIGEDGSLDLSEPRQLKQVLQGFTYFRDHDVIVAKITPCFENGKGALAQGLRNGIGFGTTELHVMRPKAQVDERFLFYITRSSWFRDAGEQMMFGAAGQKRVPEDFIKDFLLPLPGKDQQRCIAAWLDGKLERLDELVRKKERQLALLAEKRQALISHATTHGLNPNAPTKPSGISWIGDVPNHWRVVRLRDYVSYEKGRNAAEYTQEFVAAHEGEHPVYSGQTGNEGVLGLIDRFDYDIPVGIVVTTVGARAMTSRLVRGRFCLSQNCALLRTKNTQLDAEFLFNSLQPLLRYEAGRISMIMQPSLRFEDMHEYRLAVPPLDEQLSIVRCITRHVGSSVAASAKLTEQISKLREYRQVLITVAVTGQIEVPEAAA
jgi:type I restriction enzyme, S subunit